MQRDAQIITIAGACAGSHSSGGNSSMLAGHLPPFIGEFPTFAPSDFAITDLSAIASIISSFEMGPDAFLSDAPSVAPEPASLLLIGSGLLGLSVIALRKTADERPGRPMTSRGFVD